MSAKEIYNENFNEKNKELYNGKFQQYSDYNVVERRRPHGNRS